MKFRKVAILGTGLLGASFAFAAKNRGLCEKISAWSRSESTRKKCSILPEIFDEVFDSPEKAVSDADLVVICTPTENIPGIAAQIAPNLKKGAVVTDVGSVKGKICELCSKPIASCGAHFVGSHPMAGSEKIGIDSPTKSFSIRARALSRRFLTPMKTPQKKFPNFGGQWACGCMWFLPSCTMQLSRA